MSHPVNTTHTVSFCETGCSTKPFQIEQEEMLMDTAGLSTGPMPYWYRFKAMNKTKLQADCLS